MTKTLKKIVLLIALTLLIVFWIPYLIIYFSTFNNIQTQDEIESSEVAIIFGAHVTDNMEPTEILKERLEAGITLKKEGTVSKLVASNMPLATKVMRVYLQDRGIEPQSIESDDQALTTPDSCRAEKTKNLNRSLIFISQGYHLPRLIYQCQKLGIEGQGFPAELVESIDKSNTPFITKYKTKLKRHLREAALDWLVVLKIY